MATENKSGDASPPLADKISTDVAGKLAEKITEVSSEMAKGGKAGYAAAQADGHVQDATPHIADKISAYLAQVSSEMAKGAEAGHAVRQAKPHLADKISAHLAEVSGEMAKGGEAGYAAAQGEKSVGDKHNSQECTEYKSLMEFNKTHPIEGKFNDLVYRATGFGPMLDREHVECSLDDVKSQPAPKPVGSNGQQR